MKNQEHQEILEALHPLEIRVLKVLVPPQIISEAELSRLAGLESSQLDMALGWLQAKQLLEMASEEIQRGVQLTETGSRYAREKNPELCILEHLRSRAEWTVQSLRVESGLAPEEFSAAVGALKASGDIRTVAGGVVCLVERDHSPPCEDLQKLLGRLLEDGPLPLKEQDPNWSIIQRYSRKRGKAKGVFLIQEQKRRTYRLTTLGEVVRQDLDSRRGPGEETAQLTPQMLKDGSWRERTFRKYSLEIRPPRIPAGKKHPYREFLDQVKTRLLALGFEEMRGPMVETEFWNMDALYMPQFHPARDIHDVYQVKGSCYADSIPEPFAGHVARTHESGGRTGSRGWRYPFDGLRTRRLVLRSQGTAVSARTLAGQSNVAKPQIPGKYFSIARCFRYDQVDATHACDFFQVEGIVLGDGIHFRTLLGLLKLFAVEVARAQEIRFSPAYFPFTEPSVELHVRHPQLGWMELGGAGLFRPEVTQPLGVEVPVIAWGLGLDRMAMMSLQISDIRDLFSPDLEFIRNLRTHH